MSDDLIVVGTFSHPAEAEMARAVLAGEGVEAIVWEAMDVPPANPLFALGVERIRLVVAPRDVETASAILEKRGFSDGSVEAPIDDADLEREALSTEAADESVGEFLLRTGKKIRR